MQDDKHIVRFCLSGDELGHWIDLADEPVALIIDSDSGDIQGGMSAGTPFTIPCRDVLGFLAESDGKSGMRVCLKFQSIDGVRTIVVGRAADASAAAAWVQTANSVRSIVNVENQLSMAMPYELGRYLNCVPDRLAELAGDTIPVYEPAWQAAYPQDLAKAAQKELGLSARARLRRQEPMDHGYADLLDRLCGTLPNANESRLALSMETILLSKDRARRVGVIATGDVTDCAVLYAKGSGWQQHLELEHRSAPACDLGSFLSRCLEIGHAYRLPGKFQTFHGTAASHYLWNAIQRYGPEYRSHERFTTVGPAVQWMNARPDHFLVADIGMAEEFLHQNRVLRQWGIPMAAHEFEYVLIPYEQPLPAGLAYRRDDPRWGRLLHSTLQRLLQSKYATGIEESLELGRKLSIEPRTRDRIAPVAA